MARVKLLPVIVIVAVVISLYCILQFTASNHHLHPDPDVDTRSLRLQISDRYMDSRHKATDDQCFHGDKPLSEETEAKCLAKRLPKCLIIGFSKCGTYALKAFLTLHPDIVGADHEIEFFSKYYNRGLGWYREQMPLSTETQITIEKTPKYILSLETLSRIQKFNSSIKLIIIVRDPFVRLQSTYAHEQDKGLTNNQTFESWVKFTGDIAYIANYAKHINDVFRLFDTNQVLVVEDEELETSPLTLLKKVERFLGLCHAFTDDLIVFNRDKGFYCFNQSSWRYHEMEETRLLNPKTGCFAASKGREHPQIDRQLKKQLLLKLHPYNEKLFALMGKRFNWTHPDNVK